MRFILEFTDFDLLNSRLLDIAVFMDETLHAWSSNTSTVVSRFLVPIDICALHSIT